MIICLISFVSLELEQQKNRLTRQCSRLKKLFSNLQQSFQLAYKTAHRTTFSTHFLLFAASFKFKKRTNLN